MFLHEDINFTSNEFESFFIVSTFPVVSYGARSNVVLALLPRD